jgi:hypothetical protein
MIAAGQLLHGHAAAAACWEASAHRLIDLLMDGLRSRPG